MRKRFKTKKNIKNYIIYVVIIVVLNLTLKLKIIKLDPIDILNESNNYNDKNVKEKIKKLTNKITGLDINKPSTLLNQMGVYNSETKQTQFAVSIKEYSNEPLVYIYNTHQTEEYSQNNIQPYTLTPNVLSAAYYLEQKLETYGINTIVEESNISEILKSNNWNYNDSYKASRINLEKIKQQYPSIKIFIDLHRDALSKEQSTVNINDKNYAKVLFLIGKENTNYQQNLEFTKTINDKILKTYPTLTRGIMQKSGPGVNGVYNQDIGHNVILLEVGGNNNTMEEVTNTIDVISIIIKEKINEKR